jgi:hypothetical protein
MYNLDLLSARCVLLGRSCHLCLIGLFYPSRYAPLIILVRFGKPKQGHDQRLAVGQAWRTAVIKFSIGSRSQSIIRT